MKDQFSVRGSRSSVGVASVEWVWRFFALGFTFPTFRTERERWGTRCFWLFDGLQGGLLIRSLV